MSKIATVSIDEIQKVKKERTTKVYQNSLLAVLSAPALQLIADISTIFLSWMFYYYIKVETGLFDTLIERFEIFPAFVMLVYWLILFWFSGLYKNWHIRSPFDELFTVIRVTFFGSFLIFFFVFIDSTHSPRLMFLLYFIIISFFVCMGRLITRKAQVKLRQKRIIAIPSIIIGSKEKAFELYEQTLKSPSWGFKTIGIVLLNYEKKGCLETIENNHQSLIIGTVDNLHEILEKYPVKEVLISVDLHDHSKLMNIVSECSDWRINIKIIPDLYNIFTGQVRTLHIYGVPLIDIDWQLLRPWQELLKRMFDIFFSFLIILIGIPLWLLIALIVKLESKGPVFYKQLRVGKNGKVFEIYKFRSMVSDADKNGHGWTLVNDPRVTKFGKLIRKTHLDEIPQFWNVLIGDMSVVGPRPEQPKYVENFSKEVLFYKRRLKVRPGITGWWQIKYTTYEMNKEEIENRLKDDFYYIENMSLKLDLEIIFRTIYCVLKGHGQA